MLRKARAACKKIKIYQQENDKVVFSTPIKYAVTPELHAHDRLVLPIPIEMVAGRLLREEMQLKTGAGRSMRLKLCAVRYH